MYEYLKLFSQEKILETFMVSPTKELRRLYIGAKSCFLGLYTPTFASRVFAEFGVNER